MREALSQPIERTISSVQRDCAPDFNMEDVLSRDAHTLAEKLQREDSPILQIPADAIDLILNLFVNPDYDLTDEGAFEAFQGWQERCQQLQATWSGPTSEPRAADSIESLLTLASTVKQYWSVAEVKRCVDEATHDDLRVVSRDITMLRRMWLMFTKLLAQELPNDLRLPRDLILRFVLGIGRMAIYFDLSLRSHGQGGDIDSLMSYWLTKVEGAFHEKFGDANSSQSMEVA